MHELRGFVTSTSSAGRKGVYPELYGPNGEFVRDWSGQDPIHARWQIASVVMAALKSADPNDITLAANLTPSTAWKKITSYFIDPRPLIAELVNTGCINQLSADHILRGLAVLVVPAGTGVSSFNRLIWAYQSHGWRNIYESHIRKYAEKRKK